MTALLAVGLVTAVSAAVRGNWSPCGESLQAQIHPLGEKRRGNIWGVTMAAFTLGSALAGGTLTGLLGLLGSWSATRGGPEASLWVAAMLALVCGVLDLSPVKPWTHRRQVNENWINRYRGWVYGMGFGIQLGVGFAVFVMSWAYWAMLAIAFLTASPVHGALLGIAFGLGRGFLLFLSRWITTPARLAAFHRWMQSARRPVFTTTAVVTILAGFVAML